MGNYGPVKLSSKEYAEKGRDGTLTPQEIANQRLPVFIMEMVEVKAEIVFTT